MFERGIDLKDLVGRIFLNLFLDIYPGEFLYRVWDILIWERSKIRFMRIAILLTLFVDI
jgi:hypothetical protein